MLTLEAFLHLPVLGSGGFFVGFRPNDLQQAGRHLLAERAERVGELTVGRAHAGAEVGKDVEQDFRVFFSLN
jgi:hypothetical protein